MIHLRPSQKLLLCIQFLFSFCLSSLAQAECSLSQLPRPVVDWIVFEQSEIGNFEFYNHQVLATPEMVKSRYLAEKQKIFQLQSYWVPEKKLRVFRGTGFEEIRSFMEQRNNTSETRVRFFVHPEHSTQKIYKSLLKESTPADEFCATPSSSGRTLLVWKQDGSIAPFFAKLSLNLELGGRNRLVHLDETLYSVGVNQLLAARGDGLPKNFTYMPEVFGAIPLKGENGTEPGGMIIRLIPKDIPTGQKRVLPMFSLYSEPKNGGIPFLVRMLNQTPEDPIQFLRGRLIRPFSQQWVDLALNHGVSMEAHGQNTLLGVGNDGLINGDFVFRDLNGCVVDIALQKSRGWKHIVELPFVHKIKTEYYQAKADQLEWTFHSVWWFRNNLQIINSRLNNWIEMRLIPNGEVLDDQLLEKMFIAELKEALAAHSLSDFSFRGWLNITNLDLDQVTSLKGVVRVVHEFRLWLRDVKNPRAKL